MSKTYQLKEGDIKRNWHLVNADGAILGRLSSQVATFLIGKQKPVYSPNIDSGDIVVVINAEKVKLTGKKVKQKVYRSHSGYPGGFKEVSFEQMSKKNPERIIKLAVSGMLPDNRLKGQRLKRLKIVIGNKNPYSDKFEN